MTIQINSTTVIDDSRNLISTASITANTVSGDWIASLAEAQAGTDNTKIITPLGFRRALRSDGNTLSIPIYAARAWVCFSATTPTAGIPTMIDYRNVSSITDLGAGYFRVNFTTAMPDSNYAIGATTNQVAGDDLVVSIGPVAGTITTGSFEFRVRGRIFNDSDTNRDPEHASLVVYR